MYCAKSGVTTSRPRFDPFVLLLILLRHILGICAKYIRLMVFMGNIPYHSKYWTKTLFFISFFVTFKTCHLWYMWAIILFFVH
jgi:hypothetical protein